MTSSLFQLSSSALPDGAQVLAVRAESALSSLGHADVLVEVPEEDGGEAEVRVDVDATLLTLDGEGEARAKLHGIIASAELVGGSEHASVYRLRVVPRAWRLTLGEHSRVWVDKKVPEIIEELLRANGLGSDDFALSLQRRYPVMPHVCQYHESDFAFISRWMEREGIYYFFEQGDAREKLVLTDHGQVHEPASSDPVRFFALLGDEGSALEAMHRFSRRARLSPASVRVGDHNDLQPAMALRADAPAVSGGVGKLVEWGPNVSIPAEATRVARLRAEEAAAPHTVFHGEGRVFCLAPGFLMELEAHPVAALNARYLLTRVVQLGVNLADLAPVRKHAPDLFPDAPDETPRAYRVEVEAVAASQVFRPARVTPWPRVHGLEAAVVDGPLGDNHAELDEHGRYHVKIRFDESDLDNGRASCWVRMVQPHAGNPEGFHFPLRKGTEVMLAFLGGDPDRPVIVGAVPDAQNPSTVTDANRTQNVVMTGGENRIEIEDQDGSQYVSVYSPTKRTTLHLGAIAGSYPSGHNMTLSTDGDGLFHTGGDRDLTVGGNMTETVKGDVTEDYHGNQTTHVYGAHDETIDGGLTQTISAGETRTVSGGLTEDITSTETRSVSSGQTETISGGAQRSISASLTDTIGAAVVETVGGGYTQRIGGGLTQNVGALTTVTTPAAYTATVSGAVNWNSGGGFTIIAPGGTKIVDEDQQNTGQAFITLYGFKTSVVALKREGVNAISCGNYGYKSERAGVKYEDIGFANETEPVSFLTATHTWTTGALIRTAFKLIG